MTKPTSLAVTAIGPAEAAAFPFREGAGLFVCVIAKATLAFVDGAPARRVASDPVLRVDTHHGGNPTRSVRSTSELVPPKPRVDVTLVGHARTLGGVPRAEAHVTLLVAADGAPPLLAKTLSIVGDRGPQGASPFTEMPLVWERAAGGPGVAENPLGVGAGGNTGHPNVVDPRAPTRPAGFGPIAASWPSRRKRLTAEQRKGLSQPLLELGAGFDRGYFQCAPPDQQLDSLGGDEWVVLEGTRPSAPRIASRLPAVEGHARVWGLASTPRELTLRLDDLAIDAEGGVLSVVFRGAFPVASEADLARLVVLAGVASLGEPIAWPTSLDAVPRVAAPETPAATGPAAAPKLGHAGTLVMIPDAPPARPDPSLTGTLPLEGAAPAPQREHTLPVAPAAPRPAANERTMAVDVVELGPALPFAARRPPPEPPPPAPLPTAPLPAASLPAASPPTAPLPAAPLAAPPLAPEVSAAPAPPAPAFREITLVEDNPSPAPSMPFVAAAGPLPPALLPSFPKAPWTPPSRDDSPFEGTYSLSPDDHALAALEGSLPFLRPEVQELPPSQRAELPQNEREILALLPRRRGEGVPVVNASALRVGTIAWEVAPPEPTLTVLVKGTFALVDGGPAIAAEDTADPTGDLYFGDDPKRTLRYPSDYAIWKPRADVTLLGHAHAPGGRATGMEVLFSFGPADGNKTAHFERRAAILGDRTWTTTLGGRSPGAPAPFVSIPLVWERALGGPGFSANPAGSGYRASPSADGLLRLPCIEDPKRLVTSPSDDLEPVCFAPLPPIFPRRWSRIGTYDRAWRDARWPHFPEDFDWAFFQAAPKEQQLDYLVGDEPFVLAGVVPGRPRLSGSLPGVRPRVFLVKEPEDGGELHELVVRLDTATFDADAGLVHLVWRGLLRVRDEGAPELRSLFVTTEPLTKPLSRAAVLARLHAALAPKAPEVAIPPAPPPANDAPPEPENPRIAEVREVVAKAQAERDAKLAALGLRASELAPDAPSPGEVDRAQLEDVLKRQGHTDAEIAERLRPLEPPAPPAPDPTLRERVLARRAAGQSLEKLWLPGADLSELDFEGLSFAGSNLQNANLRGARLVQTQLEGCQLGGADLQGADLTGARAKLADLTGARLERSVWDGAQLDFTVFAQAKAQGASFRGAKGERPVFTEAHLEDTHFEGAELEHPSFLDACLDRAVLSEAKLPRAVLFGAKGEGLVAHRVTLTAAGAEHAAFAGASFVGLDAAGSTWERADLRRAKLTGAALAGAGFVRARLAGAELSGTDLREATLRRADLVKADLRGADLLDANLDGADLRAANLSGANLFGVSSHRAALEGAKLEGALLGKTKLGKKA